MKNFKISVLTANSRYLQTAALKSLYHNSSCSIKIAQKQTRSFRYARDVLQGCILSPLLFNLYINDVPFAFENALSDPFVLLCKTKFSIICRRFIIIILSRSKTELQNRLDKLSSLCISLMMKINPKKTKIMVFPKHGRKKC